MGDTHIRGLGGSDILSWGYICNMMEYYRSKHVCGSYLLSRLGLLAACWKLGKAAGRI